jgi:hypothetical protein
MTYHVRYQDGSRYTYSGVSRATITPVAMVMRRGDQVGIVLEPAHVNADPSVECDAAGIDQAFWFKEGTLRGIDIEYR